MKALQHLNQYLWKYRGRLFLGFIFIALTNIFNVYAPQIIGEGIDFLYNIISHKGDWEKGEYHLATPHFIQLFDSFSHWGKEISINASNIESWAWTIGIILSLGYIITYSLKGVFLFYQRQSLIVMSRHIEYDLKNEIYQQYQNLDATFYRKNRTGDLMNRISEDVSRVRMYIGPAVMYTINLIVLITLCAFVMWKINPTLTLYTLGPLPIMMIGIFYVSTIINKRTEKVQRQQSKLSTIVQETFSGIRVVKTFAREKYLAQSFAKESDLYKTEQLHLVKADALFMPVISILVGLSTILTIYIGAQQVQAGNITIGTIVQFVFYVNQLTWPFASVGWVTSLVRKAEASQSRINEFLQSKPIIANTPEHQKDVVGKITFSNVSYTYPETGIKAIQDISFEVLPGQTLGIIGKTGSGKSTILQLLTRSLEVQQGQIAIDDLTIQSFDLFKLRKAMGWVPQEIFLFSDTIQNNVAFGVEHWNQDELDKAAYDAGVLDDIISFPNGWQTILGERGINLSGGQKQRISIARAFITQPKIMMLDDCLSAVDTATEERILKGIERRMQGRSTIFISHRVSSIQNCDQIIVLDEGKIIEKGTHQELIDLQGKYFKLHQIQNQREE
jgi:ATP-binding cassette subfamily B protein